MATKTVEIKNVLVADLAASLNALDARIKELQDQRKEVANMLVHAAGGEAGTYSAGEHVFTVSANNTYDKDAMIAALRPGQLQRVSKRVIDTSMVRSAYPHVYSDARRTNGMKVTMR